jgi:hypothetical protein
VPGPVTVTVRGWLTTPARRNSARTVLLVSNVSVISATVPLASPLQPMNSWPLSGTAVSVTTLFLAYSPSAAGCVTRPPRVDCTFTATLSAASARNSAVTRGCALVTISTHSVFGWPAPASPHSAR